MGGIAATNFISNAGLPNMLLAAFIPGFRWLLPPDFYLAVAPATRIFATSPVAVRAERNASVKSTDAFKRTFAISLFASLIASGQASAQSPADWQRGDTWKQSGPKQAGRRYSANARTKPKPAQKAARRDYGTRLFVSRDKANCSRHV